MSTPLPPGKVHLSSKVSVQAPREASQSYHRVPRTRAYRIVTTSAAFPPSKVYCSAMSLTPAGGPRKRRFTWQAGTAVVGACAAVAYVLQFEIGSKLPAWGHWALLVGGAACTLGGSLIAATAAQHETVARRNAEDIAKDASREARVAMRGYLTPALYGLLQIAHDAT